MPQCRTALKWDTALADRTVRENIMTGIRFSRLQVPWHLRQAQRSSASGLCLVQVQIRDENLRLNRLIDSNFVGISAKGKGKHTDGQVWGKPLLSEESGQGFDVSILVANPT